MSLSQAEQEELELLELEEQEAAYQAAKAPSGPSVLDSTARGFASGASLGFDDEIGGAIGAAGRVAGIKNLGSWKPFQEGSRLEFDTPTISPDAIGEAYTQNRDALRGDLAADAKTNPTASTVGKVGGAVTSALVPGLGALNAGKGATLAGSVAKAAGAGALQGGLTGIGESTSDNIGEIAREASTGALTGAAIGGAIPIAGAGIGKAVSGLRGAGSAMKRGAEGLAETATGATGAQAAKFRHGAGRELLDRGLVGFGDTAERIGQKTDVAMQMANKQIDDALRSLDAQGVTASADNVVAALEAKVSELGSDASQAGTARQIRKIIDDILETGKSNIPVSDAEVTKRGFGSKIRNWVDPEVGAANKQAYLGYMDEVERAAQQADPAAAAKFKSGKDTYGLLAPIQEAAEKRGLQQNQAPLGGLGDTVAAGVGGVPGFLAKRILQPRVASSSAVALDSIADIVLKAPQALGKFAKPLQDATARGGNSLGATHFILQQTNPEYREILRKVAEEDEEAGR